MEGLESSVRAIEELGRKVERLETTLNPEVVQEEESKSVLVFAEGEFSLEDDLDRMEEELLFASCELTKIYEELDDNCDREERYLGRLDEVKFMDVCIREIEVDEKKIMELAAERVEIKDAAKKVWTDLHSYWQTKIYEYGLAIEAKEEILVMPYDEEELEKLRNRYGVNLYRTIRQGFREMRVALRTRVFKKPWNVQAGREATLSEILVTIQELVSAQQIQRRTRIQRLFQRRRHG